MVEGDGETWFPHPPARGLRSPKPSRGRGRGETRFPHTPLRGPMFTLGRSIRFLSTLLLPHRHGFGRAALDGAVSRRPAPALTRPRWGREPGASPQRGEAGRGAERCERWSPQPSMRLRRTPTGGKYFLGGRSPPKPSHRVGVWGNQGSPYPCSRALPSHTLPRTEAGETRFPQLPAQGLRLYLPGGGGWGTPVSPSPCGRVRPPCGRGHGEPRFPHAPAGGRGPPAGGGVGKPGSPIVTEAQATKS